MADSLNAARWRKRAGGTFAGAVHGKRDLQECPGLRQVAKVSSFTDLTRIGQAGQAAAVLPDLAAVDFDPKKFRHGKIDALKPRTLLLIANARSLDRSGIARGVEARLSEALRVG